MAQPRHIFTAILDSSGPTADPTAPEHRGQQCASLSIPLGLGFSAQDVRDVGRDLRNANDAIGRGSWVPFGSRF